MYCIYVCMYVCMTCLMCVHAWNQLSAILIYEQEMWGDLVMESNFDLN